MAIELEGSVAKQEFRRRGALKERTSRLQFQRITKGDSHTVSSLAARPLVPLPPK